MSLINDALKKSHKDSTGKIVMPAAPRKKRNEPGNLPAVRPSSLKRKATITLIAAICCLGVIVAVIVADGNYDSAKTLFSSLRSQVVQLVTNVTSSTSSAKTQSQTPKKGIAENTIQSQPEQTDTLSLVGKSEQGKSIPVPQAGDQATAAPSQPEEVKQPFQKVPAIGPEQNPDILKAIYELKIEAVIGHGGSARIMVDGQVFRVGEVVDFVRKYKFLGEKGDKLFFSDPTGTIYEKHI